MSKYILFGTEINFSKGADKYFYILKAFEASLDGASDDFREFYDNCSNISKVLDDYMEAVYTITENWAVDSLFNTLKDFEIYDISRDNFEEACWDLSGAEKFYDAIADKYNDIVGDLEDAKAYRSMRKASRGRVVGGGFGVGGALKGMATAGAMNAVTGLGHSIANGIGNIASSVAASSAKKDLYNSEKTFDFLDDGMRECISDIYNLYISFINDYKINESGEKWFDGSQYNVEKSNTLLENSYDLPIEKSKELLVRAFTFCPYNEKLLTYIFNNFIDEQRNVFQIAKKYKIDLSDELLEIIISNHFDDAEKICEIINDYEASFSDEENENIIEAFCEKACKKNSNYIDVISNVHKIMKALNVEESETLDDYEYDILDEIAEGYDDLPFGETDKIISSIISCKVSDQIKSSYVFDSEIWELFKKYDVTIPNEDKLLLLYKKYQDMLLVESFSKEDIKKYLDAVIDAIDFKDNNGIISYETRELMFECLTGILMEEAKAEESVTNLQDELSSGVTQKAKDIISQFGIDFMTTSLTYKSDAVLDKSKSLSYCTLNEDEQPFLIYDERPLMHPGEYGFCLTDKRITGKPEEGSRYNIPLHLISRFEKKGFLSNKFIVYYEGGSKEINAENLTGLDGFVDCLNQILKVVPQNDKAVNNKKEVLNQKMIQVSADCLDEHPFLIEYFGMEEKAAEIYHKAGRKDKRKQVIEECTDENLEVCDIDQLKEYIQLVKAVHFDIKIETQICERIDKYISLIKSCQDKRTVFIQSICKDENLATQPLDVIIQAKKDIDEHKFLSKDKKEQLLSRLEPRICLLSLEKKISDAGENYDALLNIYNTLKSTNLSAEILEQYEKNLRDKIVEIQAKQLELLTSNLEDKTHEQLKKALDKAVRYSFLNKLLQDKLVLLNRQIDVVEQRILTELCGDLTSATLEEVIAIKNRIKDDGFKKENVAQYQVEIDKCYEDLVFAALGNKCTQFSLSKIITEENGLQNLLQEFENCGKSAEECAPFINRINALLSLKSQYDNDMQKLYLFGKSALIEFVSNIIKGSVLPITIECYKPEVYIQGEDSLSEYYDFDNCKNSYMPDIEYPIFYIFQLSGKNKIPNLSITNLAMYLSKSSTDGRILRFPLESICDIKPAKIFNNLTVSTTMGNGEIYSEVSYKGKQSLANAIMAIVRRTVQEKSIVMPRANELNQRYSTDKSRCFEEYSIPIEEQIADNLNKEIDLKADSNNTASTQSTNGNLAKEPLNVETIMKLIPELVSKYGLSLRYHVVGTAPFANKLPKARMAYAAYNPNEIPLMLEDHTVFGSAKDGFVLTNEAIYLHVGNTCGKIALDRILSVFSTYNQSWKMYYINLNVRDLDTTNGNVYVSSCSDNSIVNKLVQFWTEIMGVLGGANNVTAPKNDVPASQPQVVTGNSKFDVPGAVTEKSYWICGCGKTNEGNFCAGCGSKRETGTPLWLCSCGNYNKGKFCTKCGQAKS